MHLYIIFTQRNVHTIFTHFHATINNVGFNACADTDFTFLMRKVISVPHDCTVPHLKKKCLKVGQPTCYTSACVCVFAEEVAYECVQLL